MNFLQGGYLKQYTRIKKLDCHTVSLNEAGSIVAIECCTHEFHRILSHTGRYWNPSLCNAASLQAPPATWSRYISERDSCLYCGEGGAWGWVKRCERKGWRVDGRRSRRRRGRKAKRKRNEARRGNEKGEESDDVR